MRFIHLAAAVAAAALPTVADARQASTLTPETVTTATYTQNFDSLAGSTSTNIAGWQRVWTGSAESTSYVVGNGSSNTGNIYSFGANGSTDRALGSLGSGRVTEAMYGAILTNGLGAAISSIDFEYFGEQWRRGTSGNDGLTFEYSLDATSLVNGTWTRVSLLDFAPITTSGAQGALDGNDAAFRTQIGTTLDLAIAAGQSFGFRWTDDDSTGADHGLAIDDVTIGFTTVGSGAVPEPATWALMILGFGVVGYAMRRRAPARSQLA